MISRYVLYQTFIVLTFIFSAVNARFYIFAPENSHVGGATGSFQPHTFAFLLLLPVLIALLFLGIGGVGRASRKAILVVALLLIVPCIPSLVDPDSYPFVFYELAKMAFIVLLVYFFVSAFRCGGLRWIYISFVLFVAIQFLGVVLEFTGLSSVLSERSSNSQYSRSDVARFAGFAGHPNILAGMLTFVSPFLLSGAYYERKKWLKILLFVTYLVAGILVVVSFSRTGIIVFVFTSFVVYYLARRRFSFQKHILFSLVIFGVLAIIASVFWQELLTRFDQPIARDSAMIGRFIVNNIAIDAWMANPLLGAGTNNFIYFSIDYDSSRFAQAWVAPAHNIYLLVASEQGLIGVISLFAIFGFILVKAYVKLSSNIVSSALLATAVMSSTIGLMLGFMADFLLRQDVFAPFYAFLIASAIYLSDSDPV